MGIPLAANRITQYKSILKYARILVEMQLSGEIPKSIIFKDEKGVIVNQVVEFEWKTIRCSKYKMLTNSVRPRLRQTRQSRWFKAIQVFSPYYPLSR